MATRYEPVSSVRTMSNVPRFGHSSDFSNLFRGSDDASDYVQGLLFAGLFMFIIFFLWGTTILKLKFLGPRRVGFFAGGPFRRPSAQTNYATPFICRLIFVNSGLLVVIFSVLVVTKGLTEIRDTTNTITQTARDVGRLSVEMKMAVGNLSELSLNTTLIRETLLTRLESQQARVCFETQQFQDATGVGYDDQIQQIRSALGDNLRNSFAKETDLIYSLANYTETTSAEVEEAADNVDLDDWQSLIIIIPYVMVTVFLMIGVGLASFDVHIRVVKIIMTWVLLPLFCLMILFSALVSCFSMIAASGNADFCRGTDESTISPDVTVRNIMSAAGLNTTDFAFAAVDFYVGQCQGANPFGFLYEYQDEVEAARGRVRELTEELGRVLNVPLDEVCSSEANFLDGISNEVNTLLQELVLFLRSALSILKCETIAPLYLQPVYTGTCTYSVTGVTWVFSSFLVVTTFGLVMIMLRSSWQPIEDANYDDDMEEQSVFGTVQKDEDDVYGGYQGYEQPLSLDGSEGKFA